MTGGRRDHATDDLAAERPDEPVAALVNVQTNVRLEDGTIRPAIADVMLYDDSPDLPDEDLEAQVVAEDLPALVRGVLAHFDALTARSGRPALIGFRSRGSASLWTALVAEHDLQVDDPRILPAEADD